MQVMKIVRNNTLTMAIPGFCETFVPNSVYTQCIRWKRKPIWLPPSKSKMFHIPKKPVIPSEDKLELKRLYNNYRTYMKSLRIYIKQVVEESEIQLDENVIKQKEEEDFKACSAINDEWNAKIAKQREIRLAEMREKHRNKILQHLLEEEQQREMEKKILNEQVRKVKEESVTFITAENIDVAIEECLSKVVNHNRAMDSEGKWYEGKYPPVPVEEILKTATVEQ